MGYQANYHGRRFSKGTRALIWCRATGDDRVTRCTGCTKVVTRATAEFDHIIPWEISRYSGPSNGQVLCCDGPQSCHALKSATRDWPTISKNNRVRDGHARTRARARHPMPCGRASRWSKPMRGVPVARRSGSEKLAGVLARRAILAQQAEA